MDERLYLNYDCEIIDMGLKVAFTTNAIIYDSKISTI